MKSNLSILTIFSMLLSLNFSLCKAGELPPSMLHIYVSNNTLRISEPIEITFNDHSVFSEPVTSKQAIRYKIFSKGNLHITALIKGYEATRTEFNMNILDDSLYVLVLNFGSVEFPGSMYALAKPSYDQYEIFYEEDLSSLVAEKRALSDSGIPIQKYYAINHLLLSNNTFSYAPTRVWIDDRVMMNIDVLSLHSAYCKFYSPGEVKLTAQLGNFTETKTSEIFNLENGDYTYINIRFDNKKQPGKIIKLDENTGDNLYISHRLDWKVDELSDLNSVYLEENRQDPLLGMDHEDYSLALELSGAGPSGVNFQKSYLTRNFGKSRCKDLIVHAGGDSLTCKIRDVDDENVYVTVKRNQQTVESFIPRKEILSIEKSICKDKIVDFWVSPGVSISWEALIAAFFGAGLPGGFSLCSNLYVYDLGIEVSYLTLMDIDHEAVGNFRLSMIPVMASWRLFNNTNVSTGVGFYSIKGDVTDPDIREMTEDMPIAWVLGITRGVKLYSVGDFTLQLATRTYAFYDGAWGGASTLELLMTF